MRIIDWASNKVQKFTGEKERRDLVAQFKQVYEDFKYKVSQLVENINIKIRKFNNLIAQLNVFRKATVKKDIVNLKRFLGVFGNVKENGMLAEEIMKDNLVLSEKEFELIENYIEDIDWDKEDVFVNSFLLGPIGMRIKTRKQNMSIREHLGEFNMEVTHTINQLNMKDTAIAMDCEIAEIYFFCIKEISDYINSVILPELEIVEALLQSITLKNEVLAGNNLEKITFRTDLRMLKGTIYEKHYMFIRNVFMFYIISCKIYDTPVLSNLLNNTISEIDYNEINGQKKLLLNQEVNINKSLVFDRRKCNGR